MAPVESTALKPWSPRSSRAVTLSPDAAIASRDLVTESAAPSAKQVIVASIDGWLLVVPLGIGPRNRMYLRLMSYWLALIVQPVGRSPALGDVSQAAVWQVLAPRPTNNHTARTIATIAIRPAPNAILRVVRSAARMRSSEGRSRPGPGGGTELRRREAVMVLSMLCPAESCLRSALIDEPHGSRNPGGVGPRPRARRALRFLAPGDAASPTGAGGDDGILGRCR